MKYSSESLFASSLRRKQRHRKVNFFPKILPWKRCDSITGIWLWNLLFNHYSRRLYSENTKSGSTVSKTLPMPASRDALTTHHCKHVCKITSRTTKESCNPHHCPGFYQGRRRVETGLTLTYRRSFFGFFMSQFHGRSTPWDCCFSPSTKVHRERKAEVQP